MKKKIFTLMVCFLLLAGMSGSVYAGTKEKAPEDVSFLFYSDVNPQNRHLTGVIPYADSLFDAPATVYRHALAQASMGIAFSNFREKGKKTEEQGYAVRDLLTAIGFTDLQADQYDVDTTADTVASMIARKETEINGEKCTLIAVSICGAGYNNEWLSNFAFSEDERHAGFDRAADIVLGRLLLYLFNHPVDHHVKLWICGYSRAAAIANLLGQKLSNEKICSVDDLYVYTFATPNTAIAESDWPCPSIFNIVGAFDPISTIPPAEWGYTRYGNTLFLPAQEVDSDYPTHREKTAEIYEKLTGITYWNNPNANWILQKLFQIIYSDINSAEMYSSLVKDIISGMWVTRGILPRIRLLSDMMTASVETDSSVRSMVLSFKDVFSPFLYNLLVRSSRDESENWGNGVSTTTQIMHEHYPDVYYAWMMSSEAPSELFISSPAYYRVSLLPELTIDGIEWTDGGERHSVSDISCISFDINTVLNIPGDHTYYLKVSAEKDIDAGTIMINRYTIPSLETNSTQITMDLKAGEKANIVLPAGAVPEILKSAQSDTADDALSVVQTYVDADDEKKAVMYEYYHSGWLAKNIIDLFLWLSVILLCLIAYIIIRVNISKKTKVFNVRRAFLSLMVVFFFIDQILRNFYPWGLMPIIICQGICSVSAAIISFSAWAQKKDHYTFLLFSAMLFWTAGDVITKTNSSIGTISFGIGHLVLCIAFCMDRRPSIRHLIILLASALPVFSVEILTIPQTGELVLSMVYSILLLSMTVFSSVRGKATLSGGILFLVSDLLLTLKTVLNAPGWLFFLTLGTYYLSVAILSSAAYGEAEEEELTEVPR